MEMVSGGLLNSEVDLASLLTYFVISVFTNTKVLHRFSPSWWSMPQKGMRELL